MRASWPEGYSLLELAEVDSTNAEAGRRARAGETGPLWIIAADQTRGRGRHGSKWQSLPGNLFASLLLRPGKTLSESVQLVYCSGLAASDMLAHYARAADFGLKWPNDVLAGGSKIAGLLMETEAKGKDAIWLTIGFGINLAAHPENLPYDTISLKGLGAAAPEPKEALLYLAAAFAKWYEVWQTQGFAPVRLAWLSRARGLGGRVKVRLAGEDATGYFEEIDDTGAMMLRLPGGVLRRITGGEVHLL
jgi:BirA family transcriptional regulator, biotin operon repressor / biotin---[acetyl-CoA-carboxylase] ligase